MRCLKAGKVKASRQGARFKEESLLQAKLRPGKGRGVDSNLGPAWCCKRRARAIIRVHHGAWDHGTRRRHL